MKKFTINYSPFNEVAQKIELTIERKSQITKYKIWDVCEYRNGELETFKEFQTIDQAESYLEDVAQFYSRLFRG